MHADRAAFIGTDRYASTGPGNDPYRVLLSVSLCDNVVSVSDTEREIFLFNFLFLENTQGIDTTRHMNQSSLGPPLASSSARSNSSLCSSTWGPPLGPGDLPPSPSQAPTPAQAEAKAVETAEGATIVIPAAWRIENNPPVCAP